MPQDREYQIRFPDGTIKVYPPGMDQEAMRADVASEWPRRGGSLEKLQSLMQPPAGSQANVPTLSEPNSGQPVGDWDDFKRDALTYGGMGLSLGAGLLPASLPMAVPIGLAALGGAIESKGRDENSPARSLFEAGMETFGRGAGRWAPRLANKLGLALGGVRGDTKRVLDAFENQAARTTIPTGIPGVRRRHPFPPVLGQGRRNEELVKQGGRKLEEVENASSVRIPLSAFSGATENALRQAEGGTIPATAMAGIKEVEEKFLREQAAVQAAKSIGDPAKLPAVKLRQLVNLADEVPPEVINTTTLSGRQLGNIRRAARAEADPLIRARIAKEQVIPETQQRGVATEALYQRGKEIQDAAMPEVKPINRELTDLLTMLEANRALRGGGGVTSDTGQMAVRAGLGHGLSHSAANVMGNQYSPLAKLGGYAGMFLLPPKSISHAGNLAGQGASVLPSIQRMFGPSTGQEEDLNFKDVLGRVLEWIDASNQSSVNTPLLGLPRGRRGLFE